MFASSSNLDQTNSLATFSFQSGGNSLYRSVESGKLASTVRKKTTLITKAERKMSGFITMCTDVLLSLLS